MNDQRVYIFKIDLNMKKILLSSDSNGRFDLLLPKVQQLHAKNNFDLLLLVGRVCSPSSAHLISQIHNQRMKIPLPTYFIDSSQIGCSLAVSHPHGLKIGNNFHFLGSHGSRQISGLKIAYLNGIYGRNISQISPYKGRYYTEKEVEEITSTIHQCDILLTNQWPTEFLTEESAARNELISKLCMKTSPRYHISGGGKKFFRMKPFQNRKGVPTHFINIAEIQNELPKDKYLMAIQIDPSKQEEGTQMSDSPFVREDAKDRKQQFLIIKQKQQYEQQVLDKNSYLYFYGFPDFTTDSEISQFLERWGEIKGLEIKKDGKKNMKSGLVKFMNPAEAEICLKDSGKYSIYSSRIKFELRSQSQKYRNQDCYLCKGKPNFDKSLLIHCGKYCYIALDKGPIISTHFQLVPLNHVGNYYELESEEKKQISWIKQTLRGYLAGRQQTLLTFQRYMSVSESINHCVFHCILVSEKQNNLLEKFLTMNLNRKYEFEDVENRSKKQVKTQFYIDFEINQKRYRKKIKRNYRQFDFMRNLICQLLDKPEALNWRTCELDPLQQESAKKHIEDILKQINIT